jgi:hypothetical protein
VLFARKDYQQAAATIHSILAVGPGWNWTTMSHLYGNVAAYTDQFRALEAFVRDNPNDSGSRFLLAYHYMVGGHPDAAARQLTQVVKLQPNDRVAADVLKLVSQPPAGSPSEAAAQPTPQPPNDTPPPSPRGSSIDPATLVGTWQATRDDGSQFGLTLTNEGTFNWKFTQQDRVQEFGGKFTLEGDVLALERRDGGSLIGRVVPDGAQKFNFKMVGAPNDDHGLDFNR